ncbi:hypothetical protein BH18ACT14_BH18ACT14_06660 [soil metagenome]
MPPRYSPRGVTLRRVEARTLLANKTLLWAGAVVTASAAVFFPKIQGIRDTGDSWWRLATFFVPQDREGLVLVPLVILLTFALFAFVGRRAWEDASARNRPAKVGFICALLGLVGVLAFFVSAPIMFGGLGATLGAEGRRRSDTEGRAALASAAIAVGAAAFAIGAGIWVFGEELSI